MIVITAHSFPDIHIYSMEYNANTIKILSGIYGNIAPGLDSYFDVFEKFPNLIVSTLSGISGKKYSIHGRLDITAYTYESLIKQLSAISENEYYIVESLFINSRGVCRLFAYSLECFTAKENVYSFLRKMSIDAILENL